MSSNTDGDKSQWFHDLIAWETEGERTPIQSDPPHDVVMDEATPIFLRRQAS
jgi:hypothetical protein